MTETIKKWGRGLIGATISGGANGIAVLIADPVNFSPSTAGGTGKLLFVIGISAAVGSALYLKQHPLPGDE